MNFDSLSGNHTTWVIPHFFSCSMMVLGCNIVVPPLAHHHGQEQVCW
jgi:hypothetical protein